MTFEEWFDEDSKHNRKTYVMLGALGIGKIAKRAWIAGRMALRSEQSASEQGVTLDADGRCVHCGAGDSAHHSFTCPTGLHPDRRK